MVGSVSTYIMLDIGAAADHVSSFKITFNILHFTFCNGLTAGGHSHNNKTLKRKYIKTTLYRLLEILNLRIHVIYLSYFNVH
jgi:hypothetical protein